MRGLKKTATDGANTHTDTRTWQLYDQIGPVGPKNAKNKKKQEKKSETPYYMKGIKYDTNMEASGLGEFVNTTGPNLTPAPLAPLNLLEVPTEIT